MLYSPVRIVLPTKAVLKTHPDFETGFNRIAPFQDIPHHYNESNERISPESDPG
jgi:hypothetical protein